MKAEEIKTIQQLQRYVEGCINDLSDNLSTKHETVNNIGEGLVQLISVLAIEIQSLTDKNSSLSQELEAAKKENEEMKIKYKQSLIVLRDICKTARLEGGEETANHLLSELHKMNIVFDSDKPALNELYQILLGCFKSMIPDVHYQSKRKS